MSAPVKISYRSGGSFGDDLAPVLVNGRWGYIDTRGAGKIMPQFDEASTFSEGMAAVRVGNQHGYIDKVKAKV